MEKISWTDRVKNEEVLQRVKEGKDILRTVNTLLMKRYKGQE